MWNNTNRLILLEGMAGSALVAWLAEDSETATDKNFDPKHRKAHTRNTRPREVSLPCRGAAEPKRCRSFFRFLLFYIAEDRNHLGEQVPFSKSLGGCWSNYFDASSSRALYSTCIQERGRCSQEAPKHPAAVFRRRQTHSTAGKRVARELFR